eukprot:1790270-Karenia_brevis.AAC.1
MADLMTKHLSSEVMEKHFRSMSLAKNKERPKAASQVVYCMDLCKQQAVGLHLDDPGRGGVQVNQDMSKDI